MTINQKVTEIKEKLNEFRNINNFRINLIPISESDIQLELISKNEHAKDIPEKKMYVNDSYFFSKTKIININEDFKIEL